MGLSRKPAVRARQIHGVIIVAAVFWINMFVLGFFRASGVLYVAMVRTYHCSHEQASWPFSLAGATLCMTGERTPRRCRRSSRSSCVSHVTPDCAKMLQSA